MRPSRPDHDVPSRRWTMYEYLEMQYDIFSQYSSWIDIFGPPSASARSQENGLIGMCKVDYMYSNTYLSLPFFSFLSFLFVHGVLLLLTLSQLATPIPHNLKPKPPKGGAYFKYPTLTLIHTLAPTP